MECRCIGDGNRRWSRIATLFLLIGTVILAPAVQAAEDPLVMGVFPRRNAAETTRMFQPMADHLGEQLGRRVSLVTAKDFDSFWKGVVEQRYDIVHYNQYHYIRSAHSYEVIAHIEEFGKRTIAGVIYVRKDSGITSVAQLRGRSVLFGGGEDAMVSYIANRYLLLQAGLKKDDFKSLFAVNPPNSILGLNSRQADAAGAGDGILNLPLIRKSVRGEDFVALAVSEPLLQLPIAVKRTLPADVRGAIQSTLINLKNSDAGNRVLSAAALTGTGKAEDKDYNPHRNIVRAVVGSGEPPPR